MYALTLVAAVALATSCEKEKEPGNEKYKYFIPLDDPETILLIDSWKNQESLDAHHASPMMQELADLRKKYDLHMRVERYISDENGIPSSDQKFIRK